MEEDTAGRLVLLPRTQNFHRNSNLPEWLPVQKLVRVEEYTRLTWYKTSSSSK